MTEYIPNENDYDLADVQKARELVNLKLNYYREHYPDALSEIRAMIIAGVVLWDLESDLAEL